MKSKLSATNYVRKNKKQVWVMIIALALTFTTMYLINFILMTTQESFEAIFLERPKKVGYFDLSYESMGLEFSDCETEEEATKKHLAALEDIRNRLKEIDGIREVYYTQSLCALYEAIAGSMSYEFPLLEPEQIEDYLNHIDAKLIDGKMPSGPGEILVEKHVFQNQNLTIGGKFLEKNYGDTFTVSGVIENDSFSCVGTPQGYTNTGWYFVVLCDEEHCNMTKLLSEIGITVTEYDTIMDIETNQKFYQEDVIDVLSVSVLGIMIVIMVFLTIAILVAYISFMRNRVNEYCLYASIGYSRMNIYGMMMREIGLIFGISILLGAALSIPAMVTVKNLLLDQLGLRYQYFYKEHLLRILTAFIVMVGILQIPILIAVNKVKTIDMMEE